VWAIELSRDAAPGVGPRRATIALSSGFGVGPLASGLLAQYAPLPTVLPYALHVAVLGAMIVRARGTVDTVARHAGGPRGAAVAHRARSRRLARVLARGGADGPFVFGFPTIVFAVLPSMLGGAMGPRRRRTRAVVRADPGDRVLVQPITRRFDPTRAARLGW